jgi:hypothetical protein
MKKAVATLALTGLLVAAPAGVVAAKDDPGGAPADEQSVERGRRHRKVRLAAKVAAETIGISTEELKAQVQSGKTIAQVAEEHGVAASAVVDAIVEARTAKLRERAEQLVQHQFGPR